MNKHIESVHEGMNPFKCNYCDKSFPQKHHLNGHIKSVHELKKEDKQMQ